MAKEYKDSPTITTQKHTFLYVIFLVVLLGRFLFPLHMHPFDFLITDPGRHWLFGKDLFEFYPTSGIDPKFYHFYLYFVHLITQDNKIAVALLSGTLCAGMQFVWYKFAREILPKKTSLIFGILIGLCPSLLFIFGLFMSETLLLVLLGLGLWLAARAYRKKTILSFSLMVFVLISASLTRVFALPLALLCIVGLIFLLDQKLKRSVLAIILTITLATPGVIYGYKTLNVFAPFGYPMVNMVYRKSNMTIIKITMSDKREFFEFGSPSFYGAEPLAPFSSYKTSRTYNEFERTIDTRNGAKDWWKIYNSIPTNTENLLMDLKDNFVFYFFGPSWPDDNYRVNLYVKWQPYVTFHKHLHLIWAPMLLLIILYTPLLTCSRKERFILFITFGLTFLALIQQSAIMEGRYRKPMEPLYILSLLIVLRHFLTNAKSILLPRLREQAHQANDPQGDEHENAAQSEKHQLRD